MNLTAVGRWLMRSVLGSDDGDERMTAERALMYAPVWHCVSKITGAFKIMPLNVHRQSGREKSIQTRHPSYRLLRWRSNAYQTPSAFKSQMMCHALLWGNGRAYIRREGGIPVELIPLLPDRTATQLVEGEKWHGTIIERDDRLSLWEDMEQHQEKTIYFHDSEVLHIPGLGFDGVSGKSLISLAAQSWGVGLGAEKHAAKQQKKGYAGGLMLEAPETAFRDEGQAREFLKNFREQHEGADNSGKIGLLRGGVKANVLAMNNQDAQFIEQRRFQREDAALWFLLEGILGDSSNASYASEEQKKIAYRINCLAPWTTTWEEECDIKLLTESERNRGFYHKFNDGALMRTEKSVTMSFISQGIASRVLNPNEGRDMLDMNPYAGGDEYLNPAISPGGANNQPKKQATTNEAWLRELLTTEANRVLDTTKSKNFVAKMDEFYGRWVGKLADKIEAMGGDRDLAARHCQESKRRLLECADRATPETLSDEVKECLAAWPARVYGLLKEMEACLK